jgi:hypothetical protein
LLLKKTPYGGPGFNAHAERQVLCEQFPNVNFWDQPPIHTTRDTFHILMDAAVAEVEKMCEARRGPIKLMANSFAAHLVSGLLERISHRISAYYLFGAVYDIPAGYLNLLGIMANSTVTDGDSRARISAFIGDRTRHTADKDKIWDYYDLIISAADFMRYYWPRKAQYDAWNDCVSNGPDFDFTTFRNVMNDFLLHHYERHFSFGFSGNHNRAGRPESLAGPG